MAPVFVQAHVGGIPGNGADSIDLDTNIDVGAGTNRTLVAAVTMRDFSGDAPTVSSVVFDPSGTSENFTFRVRSTKTWAGSLHDVVEIWTLDNPTNKTANVVATLSKTESGGTLMVMEFTDANNGVGANTGTSTGQSTSPSVTFTTGLDTSLIVGGIAIADGSQGASPGTNVTERAEVLGSSYESQGSGWSGTKAATGGSDTINATLGSSLAWSMAAIELKAAASGTQYTSSPAGTLTTAGTVANRAGKPLGGTVTSAGALINAARKIIAGALTSNGAVVMQTAKALAGELSSSGVVVAVKTALVALAGELASAGVVIARANKAIGGTVTSVGILINRTRKPLMGTLPSAGDVLKRTGKILSGELTSSGVAAAVKTALQVLGGTLTSAGTLTLRTGKSLTGMVTSSGSVIIQTAKSLAGALGSAGEVIKQTTKGLAGTLSSSGALATARLYLSVVGGTLTSAGALAVRAGKSLSGAIMPEGGIARAIAHVLAGILTPVGDISITSTAAIVTSARRRRYTPHRDEILYNLVNTMGGAVRLYNTLRKPRKR